MMLTGRTAWGRWVRSLVLAALGCSSGAAEPCGEGEACALEGQVQVATWWGTRGELFLPFDVLTRSLSRTTSLTAKLAHRLGTKEEHTLWVEEQLDPETLVPQPLDVLSANNGDEVLRWTDCAASGSPPATPRLRGLTKPELGVSTLEASWIETTFPPQVMETLKCHGETYALPVGIHRINTLLYNKRLFRAAGYSVDGSDGLPLPNTLEELHTAAAAIAERLPESSGVLKPSVFAVAGHEAWTLSLFAIENVMLSLADDADHYKSFWEGANCDERLLRSTLSEFVRLRRWFGNWELSAPEALSRVVSGQAAMMVNGDWAAAEPSPEAVGTIPFPGTARYFVFSADVFALPDIPSADPGKGLAWLRAVTMTSTQREFSAVKHALSARTELEGELAPGPNAPEWIRSLPAIFAYVPDGPFKDLQNRLQTWLYSEEDTGDAVVDYARQEYPKLSNGKAFCAPAVLPDEARTPR